MRTYPYHIPFLKKVKVYDKELSIRTGHFIGNQKILGEFAPLPGLHTSQKLINNCENLQNSQREYTKKYGLPPKIQYKSSSLLFNSPPLMTQSTIPLKIKINQFNYSQILSQLNNLSIINPLRFDFNGDLNINTFTDFQIQLLNYKYNLNVEYIEDPVNNLNDWDKIREISKYPLAMDLLACENSLIYYQPDYWILKPSLFLDGNIFHIKDFIKNKWKKNNNIILSGIYETKFSHYLYLNFFECDDQYHGFGTNHYLDEKVLVNQLKDLPEILSYYQ